MNCCEKGKRGERDWRDELRAHGYEARRGQQFSGSPDSPDVVCPALPGFHFEVKHTERLNVHEAMAQAIDDAVDNVPVVAQEEPQRLVGHDEARRQFDLLGHVTRRTRTPPRPPG